MHTMTAVLVAGSLLVAGQSVRAQDPEPKVPADQVARVLPRQKLEGPRFGFTVFTGDVAKLRKAMDQPPIMTQFGWQLETQLVSMSSHAKALLEFVFLVGGLEQSEFNASMAWLAGYRIANGLEFGVGPNFSLSGLTENQLNFTSSLQVAAGATIPFGDLYIPVNASVGIARGGPRLTMLMGWIIGSGE